MGAGFSRRVLFAAVFLSLVRGGALPLIAVIVSVPAAVSTAYSMVPQVVAGEASELVHYFSGRGYVSVVGAGSCSACPRLVRAYISYGNRSVEAYAAFMPEGLYESWVGHYPKGCLSGGDGGAASAGAFLASALGIRRGDVVGVCYGGVCSNLTVQCFHRGPGALSSSVVVFGKPPEGGYGLVLSNGSWVAEGLVRGASSFFTSFSEVFSVAVAVAYAPLMYLGVGRVRRIVSEELESLRYLGAPMRALSRVIGAASLALASLLTVFGVAAGVLLTHAALWALRFLGVIVPSRPLPSAWGAAVVTASVLAVFSSSLVVAYVSGGGGRG